MRITPVLLSIFFSSYLFSQTPIYTADAVHHPIVGKKGMVASQHALASQVGLQILEDGGNAVDAAVAVGFALAVVLPRAGNLGGGGFMLVYDEEEKKTKAINYRERAPSSAFREMYLDEKGEVDNEKFNQSYRSIGVPGTVAGMTYALGKYGTMDLKKVMQPAIELAKMGFPISDDLSILLVKYEERLKKCQATSKVFYPKEGYYKTGDLLIQKDLAWSLEQIANDGCKAFYKGKVGERMVKGILSNGGIITKKDLKNYKVDETDAISGDYKGYTISSMPPPSSGGVHIIQMLNILEAFNLNSLGHNSAGYIHLLSETMRRAYADRSEHLGDPLFWKVPVEGLLSKEYAEHLRGTIDLNQASDSEKIKAGSPEDYESEETTHFSVVDQYGNAVSNTYTLNFSFGNGLMVEGTGFLLNNEMGDFSAKPGSANAFGLIGNEANEIVPGKRPLSSMSPVIVFKNDKPFLVTGSPGGSRIITTVLQVILNVLDFKMNIAEASHAPRIHHQWYPDLIYHEKYFNSDTKYLLEALGHQLQQRPAMGSAQSIMCKDGHLLGSSDPRRPDASTLGY